MKGFDPLQMLTAVFIQIQGRCMIWEDVLVITKSKPKSKQSKASGTHCLVIFG